jgi:hypothetical protein
MPSFQLYSTIVAAFYILIGTVSIGFWYHFVVFGFVRDTVLPIHYDRKFAVSPLSNQDRIVERFSIFAIYNSRRARLCSTLAATSVSPYLSAEFVYFDLQVQGQDIGRLVFQLKIPSPLPLHAENLIKLCRGDQRSIDPLATYVGCAFDYSTDYIEDGKGRYRWSHVLRGNNRNALGRADEALSDPTNQLQCTHSMYGGQYYGDKYDASKVNELNEEGVLLTVQIRGPGRGSSRWQLVRVGESPPEWGERLLLNTGVIGHLVSGIDTVHAMARQTLGPPTVVQAGVLSSIDI